MHKHWSKYTALGRLYVKMFLAFGKYAVCGGRWAGMLEVVVSQRLMCGTSHRPGINKDVQSHTTDKIYTKCRYKDYTLRHKRLKWTEEQICLRESWCSQPHCDVIDLFFVFVLAAEMCPGVCSHFQHMDSKLCTGSLTGFLFFFSAKAVVILVVCLSVLVSWHESSKKQISTHF